MFHHFVVTTKTTQPLLQVFYNPRQKSWNTCVIFRSPMLIWVCSHFSAPKYARLNIGDLSENKGVKRECKKFGENSRQMAPVSTICDEYCRLTVQLSGNFAARLTSFFTYRKMLPRSTIVGYDELCLGFFPFPLSSKQYHECCATVQTNRKKQQTINFWCITKYREGSELIVFEILLIWRQRLNNIVAGCSWTFYARHFA